MPQPKHKPSNPLEQAIQAGTIGFMPDVDTSALAGAPASETPGSEVTRQQGSEAVRQLETLQPSYLGSEAVRQQGVYTPSVLGSEASSHLTSKASRSGRVSRVGWVQQAMYLPPDLRKWLRLRAVDEEREIGEIVAEALQDYRARREGR